MVNIKFYGGVNEIGGNKILVEDKKHDASVFLDFGMNFTVRGKYFEEFIQPRTSNGIKDFLELNLLPDIKGIYRHDLLEFAGMEKHQETLVDAIILSHAHLDHSAHISFIDEKIPVFCNEITYTIMEAIQETSPRKMEFEIIDFKKRPLLNPRDEPIDRKFNIVNNKLKVHGLEIEMIPVDHSIPGATAFIIYGSDKTIAYSGDLRMHGTHGHLTQEFVEKLKLAKPDIFLCEGTRIDETERNNEAYVKVNSDKVISEANGLVIVDFAFKDITRFKTFFDIAKSNKRKMAIPFKDAYYIRELSKFIKDLPSLNDENILLYQDKRYTGTYIEKDYMQWEREFLDEENAVKADYIGAHQDEIMIALGYYDVAEFIDLIPKAGSIYIKSASEAFNEEQLFDMDRLQNWLNHFGLKYFHFHASGHAPGEDIVKIINESNAKILMPIHTEHPEMFSLMVHKNIELPILSS